MKLHNSTATCSCVISCNFSHYDKCDWEGLLMFCGILDRYGCQCEGGRDEVDCGQGEGVSVCADFHNIAVLQQA